MRNQPHHRYPRLAVLCLLTLIPLSLPSTAQDPAPVVLRASIAPKGNIWVGQRVYLRVDVLSLEGWAGIENLGDITVEGVQVVHYETQGSRLADTIQGVSYNGQRYEYSIFPRRGGTIVVPPIPVDVVVKTWGAGGDYTKSMETPELRFEAAIPPGAEGIRDLVSTAKFSAQQRWEPAPGKFQVGDAIKRIITRRAGDVSGMSFAPIVFEAGEGVRVYPNEPSVHDSFYRGDLTGQRVDAATFLFENAGEVVLPDMALHWWDIENEQLVTTTLKGLKLSIVAAPVPASEAEAAAAPESVGPLPRQSWPVLALMALVVVGLWLFRKPVSTRWSARRAKRRNSEKAYFRRFARSARAGIPKDAANHLVQWLDRIHDGPGAARLDHFLDEFGDKRTVAEADKLWQAVTDGAKSFDGKALLRGVTAGRRCWLHQESRGLPRERVLPPLNPPRTRSLDQILSND